MRDEISTELVPLFPIPDPPSEPHDIEGFSRQVSDQLYAGQANHHRLLCGAAQTLDIAFADSGSFRQDLETFACTDTKHTIMYGRACSEGVYYCCVSA